MSTHITALVAGLTTRSTTSTRARTGPTPLGVFCRRSLADHLDADEILTVTKQGFAFFESAFGMPYAFGKYDQLFVPEFNAGAMENAGCVTFLEDYVFRSRVTYSAYEQRANTIPHEMAHMWFGDLVTMKWWDDLWLNESFAEWASHYASVAATRYTDAWTSFAVLRKAWAYRQDQLPSTHPIVADMTDLDAVRVNFDGITYAKGASALKQLVAWVGEEEFWPGCVPTSPSTRGATSSCRTCCATRGCQRSRSDRLDPAVAADVRVNLLRPQIESQDGGHHRFHHSAGTARHAARFGARAAGPPTLRRAVSMTSRASWSASAVSKSTTGALTEVPALVGEKVPELVLLNDGDLTFAKIRLDDHRWRPRWPVSAGSTIPWPRTPIWGAAWDMTATPR